MYRKIIDDCRELVVYSEKEVYEANENVPPIVIELSTQIIELRQNKLLKLLHDFGLVDTIFDPCSDNDIIEVRNWKQPDLQIGKDGSSYYCCHKDKQNLAEDKFGFGDTVIEAIKNYYNNTIKQ